MGGSTVDLGFDIEDKLPHKKGNNYLGLFALGLSGGAAIALSVVCYPFVSPALRRICLPYVPATRQQVANVLAALRDSPNRGANLLDVGSGDGRIVSIPVVQVLAAAKEGFKSVGVELNLWLVLYSRLLAYTRGVSASATFHRQDLWNFSMKPYRNVVIFGVGEMMPELEKKFSEELSNARVVVCRFPLPNKMPVQIIGSGIDTVWVYDF